MFRRNQLQFLSCPVFLFWLTIAILKARIFLKENYRCAGSSEAQVPVNNSRAISHQVVLMCFPHRNSFWGKGALGKISVISTREETNLGGNVKSRRMNSEFRDTLQTSQNRGHILKDFASLLLTTQPEKMSFSSLPP